MKVVKLDAQFTARTKVKITSALIWMLSGKVRNRKVKSINGNRNSIKIAHWNLGSRHWRNKTLDVLHMVQEHDPDIAVISEANLFATTPEHERQIQGYTLTGTKEFEQNNCSRIVLLTKDTCRIQILHELMEVDIATIWCKIPRKGRKTLKLGAIYREHQILGKPETEGEQDKRWDKIIAQWKKASIGAEVVTIGDTNLDKLKWQTPEQANQGMVNTTKLQIETLGYHQLVQGPTRFWPNKLPSLIDQVWSNTPETILQCNNLTRPVADHNLITTVIRLKGKAGSNQEYMKRKWKDFSTKEYLEEVNKVEWEQIYKIKNVDLAYHFIESNLQRILNKMAPITKCQTNKKFKNWISKETKDLMEQRNTQWNTAKGTNLTEDWNKYRKTKNYCTTRMRLDRKNYMNKLFENSENQVRNLYKKH